MCQVQNSDDDNGVLLACYDVEGKDPALECTWSEPQQGKQARMGDAFPKVNLLLVRSRGQGQVRHLLRGGGHSRRVRRHVGRREVRVARGLAQGDAMLAISQR